MLIRPFAVLLCLFSFAFSGCAKREGSQESKAIGWSRKQIATAEWLATAKTYNPDSGAYIFYYHGDLSCYPSGEDNKVRIEGEIVCEYFDHGYNLFFCRNVIYNKDSEDIQISGKYRVYLETGKTLVQWIESNK